MSERTRYLLANTGINVTEQDIELIDCFGHPEVFCQLLVWDRMDATKAKNVMDEMVRTVWNARKKNV